MALHWSDPPQDVLIVHEHIDAEGDIVYGVALRTHCRDTIDRLGRMFGLRVVFRRHDEAHDHIDD